MNTKVTAFTVREKSSNNHALRTLSCASNETYCLYCRTGIALITCHLLRSTQVNNHTKRFYCSMMNQVIICILMDVSNTLIGIAHFVFYGVTVRSVFLSPNVLHILANSAEPEFGFCLVCQSLRAYVKLRPMQFSKEV